MATYDVMAVKSQIEFACISNCHSMHRLYQLILTDILIALLFNPNQGFFTANERPFDVKLTRFSVERSEGGFRGGRNLYLIVRGRIIVLLFRRFQAGLEEGNSRLLQT